MACWGESDMKKEHHGSANNLQTFTNQFIKLANPIFKPMETNLNLNLVESFSRYFYSKPLSSLNGTNML